MDYTGGGGKGVVEVRRRTNCFTPIILTRLHVEAKKGKSGESKLKCPLKCKEIIKVSGEFEIVGLYHYRINQEVVRAFLAPHPFSNFSTVSPPPLSLG